MEDALSIKPYTVLFNVFFKGLNELVLDPGMSTYHKYYLKLVNVYKLMPGQRTFNTLLRAVKLSNPSLYGFARYFIREMHYFEIPCDANTVNEILSLCAKHPENPNNLQAANSWFAYYLIQIYQSDDKHARHNAAKIFNSYMNVWVNAGDKDKVKQIVESAHIEGILSNEMKQTYQSFKDKVCAISDQNSNDLCSSR